MMEALFHCNVMRPMLLILLLAWGSDIAKTWLQNLLFHDRHWLGKPQGQPSYCVAAVSTTCSRLKRLALDE